MLLGVAVARRSSGENTGARARDAVFGGGGDLGGYPSARSPRAAYDPEAPVHVIDIDEAALDLYGQWPWPPRSYMAALTDRLFAHGGGGRSGYDVLLSRTPTGTSPERIVESWSRFAQGIPPALPDLGLVPHDARFLPRRRSPPGAAVVLSLVGDPEGGGARTQGGRGGHGPCARRPDALSRRRVGNLPRVDGRRGRGLAPSASGGTPMASRAACRMGQRDRRRPDALRLSAELLRVAQGAGGHILRTTEASGEVSGGEVTAAVAMRKRRAGVSRRRPMGAGFRNPFPGQIQAPDARMTLRPATPCWRLREGSLPPGRSRRRWRGG